MKKLWAFALFTVVGISCLLFLERQPRKTVPSASIAETNKSRLQMSLPGIRAPLHPRVQNRQPTLPQRLEVSTQGLADLPVEQQQRIANELLEKSAPALFESWHKFAQSGTDSLMLELVADALAFRLQQGDAPEVYGALHQFVIDTTNDPYFRWQLIQVFGEAATMDALQQLLFLGNTNDSDVKEWALYQIARIGDKTWEQRFHPELSPLLENAWRETVNDPDAWYSLASGLATVGAEEGINLLFDAIADGGKEILEFQTNANERAWAAYSAMEFVRNPDAISLIATKLRQKDNQSMMAASAGYSLSSMGQRAATEALLNWAQETPQDISHFVADWITRMRDVGSLKAVVKAMEGGQFMNARNGDALTAAYARWKSQRSPLLPHLERNQ